MLLLKLNMLLFSFLFTGFTAFAQTGFYSFGEEAGALSGKAVGPFGKVIIGKVRNNQAQFFLYVCNGAPANHTGTVMGTLKIVNNKAVYKQAHSDKYCQYAFLFDKGGVSVSQGGTSSDCGLGQNVTADGYYKRTSSAVPTEKDLQGE